jgi:DDE family transposase
MEADTALADTALADTALGEKLRAVLPHLNERQRRLVLAAEARALGYGGVVRVARAAGVSRPTIHQGLRELAQPLEEAERVRRPGGGRKALAERDPALLADLEALVDPDTRGDPMSPLRWTCKSTGQLASALAGRGHSVGQRTVAKLLDQAGYSLQAPAKRLEGAQHPDRDAQFRYLNEQVKAFLAAGQPVVSVDAKKKELVGAFKNGGREWQPAGRPELVNVYDVPDPQLGKAIPYGIYRDLRCRAQHRLGERWPGPRHGQLCRRQPGAVVAGRRGCGVSGRGPAADLRRWRRQSRLPGAALESRVAAVGRCHWPGRDGLPSPTGHQ